MNRFTLKARIVAPPDAFQDFKTRFKSAVVAATPLHEQEYLRRDQKSESAAARLLEWHTEMAWEAMSRAPEMAPHIFDRAVEFAVLEIRNKLA
jgi:hypothetical protein